MVIVDQTTALQVSTFVRAFADFARAFAEVVLPGEELQITMSCYREEVEAKNMCCYTLLGNEGIVGIAKIEAEWINSDESLISHHNDLLEQLENWLKKLPRQDRKARIAQFSRKQNGDR